MRVCPRPCARWFSFLCLALAAWVAAAGEDEAIATYRGQTILAKTIYHEESVRLAELTKRRPDAQITPKLREEVRANILERELKVLALSVYLKDHNIPLASDAAVDEHLSELTSQLEKRKQTLSDFLAALGKTEPHFRAYTKWILSLQQHLESQLPPEEVTAAMQKYWDDEGPFPIRRASHILVAYQGATRSKATRTKEEARQRAEDVLGKAKQGEDFAALAKTYSDDPGGQDGGDLGFFHPDAMVQPFTDAVYELEQVNALSPVVETEFGFHVIKFTEDKTPQFRRAALGHLLKEKVNKLLEELLTEARKEAQINEELLKRKQP